MNTDYRFYVDSYGGNEISEEAWIRLSQRSEQWGSLDKAFPEVRAMVETLYI